MTFSKEKLYFERKKKSHYKTRMDRPSEPDSKAIQWLEMKLRLFIDFYWTINKIKLKINK